ncbi:MAG TPA: methylmalonyl-CoA epimerase [Streptosporangiaceae bacterium]|jgi:methylmalonyl-CoA/ethylmalonyl-CoA epimerase
MLTRIDHIGIACHDLEATVEFYRRTYGLTDVHIEESEEQGVREAMLKVNDAGDGGATYIQLLQPIRDDSPVAKFLARNGEGVHHIAFGTDDVRAAAGAVGGTGVRVLYESPRRGSMDSRINFLHPKDCGGVLTELVQAAPPTGAQGATQAGF